MHQSRNQVSERTRAAPMPALKNGLPPTDDFGARLAELRKKAGYTQQQLAEEVGTSRRVIAYYEGESEHPIANLLVNLANALGQTTDALLGVRPKRKYAQKGIMTSTWGQRARRIERLDPERKQHVLMLIDAALAAEQVSRSTKT